MLINALTHGNEICGMVAATHLLDTGIRPLVGTLTISFANVAAYESFDPARPFESRQLVHNLNRVWSIDELEGVGQPELRRARTAARGGCGRPYPGHPLHQPGCGALLVYPGYARNAAAAMALGRPPVHLVMPSAWAQGRR